VAFFLSAGICVLVVACGNEEPDESACTLLGRQEVAAALRMAGVEPARLRRSSSESLDQSVCAYRGRGTNVRLNIDSAPEARRRYFNRVTEALHLSVNDPGNRPQPVQGLGDEDASGPAGAYWVADFRQLFVLRGERLFIYQVAAPALGAPAARRAAARLARGTLPGSSRRAAPTDAGDAAAPELLLLAPEEREVVRSEEVVVRGTITGAGPTVRIDGRAAPVRDGTFALTVRLHRGRNRIRVAATAGGQKLSRTLSVRRGVSARAVGDSFARRRPGRVPNLLGEPLAYARDTLRGAALPHRIVKLAAGSLEQGGWAVCRTKPAAEERVRAGQPVVLFVDRADPFRASNTACAQE
jgi:hypothetical protein